jgi:serine/threonine-protein kinase mTOR
MTRLSYLSDTVEMVSECENVKETSLRVRCWLELGEWKLSRAASPGSPKITEATQADVLTSFKRATLLDNCGYKAWHNWALLNFRIALQISGENDMKENRNQQNKVRNHIVAAIHGFVNAINQGTKKWCASVQQDLLNLLTCLFKFGNLQDVAVVINECIDSVAIEAWLGVLPQLLARIHIQDPSCRAVLHPLLTKLGEKHPQALMYPLSVLLKSPVAERKQSAESLMNSLKTHSCELVEEALLVSSELIRVAIIWLETWYEGLEDASRLYFGAGNATAMLELLLPLHENLEKGAETKIEKDFVKAFGQDLEAAHRHLKYYLSLVSDDGVSIPPEEVLARRHNNDAEAAINRAWGTSKNVVVFLYFESFSHFCASLFRYLLHCLPTSEQTTSFVDIFKA